MNQKPAEDEVLDVDAIIGPEGKIARRLARYEHRPQQLEMARAVTAALQAERHLVAEAGTGTGKSFAYLVPAILHATRSQGEAVRSQGAAGSRHPEERQGLAAEKRQEQEKGKEKSRVVISTHTIALQEQLVRKDLPLLNSIIPREFAAVLVKGRSNYISLRRLEQAYAKAISLFSSDIQIQQLREIRAWAKETADGSRSSLPFLPDSSVWDEVQSDTGNCLGRKCPTHDQCFYYRARRRAAHAEVLIVNHALFFSDLALRAQESSILPNYEAVVFDECHTIESVASDHLGLRLSSTQVEYALNKIFNDRTTKGLVVTYSLPELQNTVFACHAASNNYFADLLDWWETSGRENGRVPNPGVVANQLSEPLRELAMRLKTAGEKMPDESSRKDLTSAADRLTAMADAVVQWNEQRIAETVYWLERSTLRRGGERVSLAAAPIHIGHAMATELFGKVKSVIMTSATLAVGAEKNFDFFASRVGLTNFQSLQVGSPFDYRRQAKLFLSRQMPDPSLHRAEFEKAILEPIRRHVAATEGHAFILFTSYDLLRRTANSLLPWLVANQLTLYSQAGDQSRTQILEAFRAHPRGVLLGTDSFWQGVDVPGDALQNVIITKLPFSVPDHPLLEARLEHIRQSGGNPFRDYQLPEAVIKLRQGFGRLIRTTSDTGRVVILDPRILTKPYGRIFLDSLPPCEVIYE